MMINFHRPKRTMPAIQMLVILGALAFLALRPAAAFESAGFDHGDYDKLLHEVVNDQGWVDYSGLIAKRPALDAYITHMGAVAPEQLKSWPRAEQLAFYINAYNAVTLLRIINHYPPEGHNPFFPKTSIRQISGAWKTITNKLAGEEITLDALEQTILRAKYKEPRIHAAIVCASISCPPLSNEAYTGGKLEQQLDRAAERFARSAARNRIDIAAGKVTISAIFKWFNDDFARYKADVPAWASWSGKNKKYAAGLGFLARYGDPSVREFLKKGDYKVEIGDYDWGLNTQ